MYDAMRSALEDVFAVLYLVDAKQLTLEQRVQHQTALSAAHQAMARMEKTRFCDLPAPRLQALGQLSAGVQQLHKRLLKLKQPEEKLQEVNQHLQVLAALVRVFA